MRENANMFKKILKIIIPDEQCRKELEEGLSTSSMYPDLSIFNLFIDIFYCLKS